MEALDYLVNCGLTENEAELYLRILGSKKGYVSASDIYSFMGFSRQTIYRLMNDLIQKGFLRQTLERPRKYIAVNPTEALGSLINERKQQITQLEKIRIILEDLLSEFGNYEVDNPEFRIIHHRKNIYSSMADTVLRAKQRVDLLTDDAGLYHSSLFGLTDILNEMSQNGVYVRLLTKITPNNSDIVKRLSPKIRVKHGFHPDQNILIADEKKMLTFIQTDDAKKMKSKADTAFFTTSSTFITQQSKIFNYFWENALDLKTRLAEVKAGEEYEIQPLIGERNLIKKMAELAKMAENELLVYFSPKYLSLYKSRFINFMKDEKIPGEIVHAIIPYNYDLEPEIRYSLDLKVNMRQIKNPQKGSADEQLLSRLLIYDEKYAVVMLEDVPDPPSLDAGFWTTHKGYVSKLREKFMEVWNNAEPIT